MGAAGALSFSAWALVLAAVTIRFKQAPGTAYLLAGISVISGLYSPSPALDWIQCRHDLA